MVNPYIVTRISGIVYNKVVEPELKKLSSLEIINKERWGNGFSLVISLSKRHLLVLRDMMHAYATIDYTDGFRHHSTVEAQCAAMEFRFSGLLGESPNYNMGCFRFRIPRTVEDVVRFCDWSTLTFLKKVTLQKRAYFMFECTIPEVPKIVETLHVPSDHPNLFEVMNPDIVRVRCINTGKRIARQAAYHQRQAEKIRMTKEDIQARSEL